MFSYDLAPIDSRKPFETYEVLVVEFKGKNAINAIGRPPVFGPASVLFVSKTKIAVPQNPFRIVWGPKTKLTEESDRL